MHADGARSTSYFLTTRPGSHSFKLIGAARARARPPATLITLLPGPPLAIPGRSFSRLVQIKQPKGLLARKSQGHKVSVTRATAQNTPV